MMRGHMMRAVAEAEEERPQNTRQVMWRLVRLLAPYKRYVVIALLLTLVNAATQGLGPMLIGRGVDDIISKGNKTGLLGIVAALLLVYAAGMFSMRFQMYFMSISGQKVLADLRRQVFERIQSLHLQYMEGRQAGDLMSRLVNDIEDEVVGVPDRECFFRRRLRVEGHAKPSGGELPEAVTIEEREHGVVVIGETVFQRMCCLFDSHAAER